MALALRWKWLLRKTHNLVICLPWNQCSKYEAISVAKWRGCAIQRERACHSWGGGHLLMSVCDCRRTARSHWKLRRPGMPPSVLQPLTRLAHPRASQSPRSQVRGGAYPEQSQRTSEAWGVMLLCRDWWVTELAKFLHVINRSVQVPSVFPATHIPSFSCPHKCIPNILCWQTTTLV